MYMPAYVPPGYNVTLFEYFNGIPVTSPVSHEKLIETMTLGKPEERPFKFPALVSEARMEIQLSLNLEFLASCLKNPPRTFTCNALSFVSMKKNKSGVYEGAKIEIEPDDFKVSGHMLFLDKTFNTPALTSLRNQTLWSLALKVNDIWIKDIAIDAVVFPSFANKEKFCGKKECMGTNPLLQLSPFWYKPAKMDSEKETEGKTDIKALKRTREENRNTDPELQKNRQRTYLGYVSDQHEVCLWMVNSASKVPHKDVIEQMTIGKENEEPFPVPCLVSKTPLKITIKINLRNCARDALQKTEQIVEKLVFYQQKRSGEDLISHPIPFEPTILEIRGKILYFETIFTLPETPSSLKSNSLWNLAIKISGIWILEMGTDLAVFDNFHQMEDYCYQQSLDEHNALFNLSPFWYNQNMRDEHSSRTPKKSKSHLGKGKKDFTKLDLLCDEDFSTLEEKPPEGRSFFIILGGNTPFQKRIPGIMKSKRARNTGTAELKAIPNNFSKLDDSAPQPIEWEKPDLEPLFPDLVDVFETTFF